MKRTYIAIDLKSFYASVECRELGLDPMSTNLVVADDSRTDKTICLAVSPSLKSFGLPGRPRLYEVIAQIKKVNAQRRFKLRGPLEGKSYDYHALCKNPKLAVDYITTPPRMSYYIDYSTKIFEVYLKYIAREDIHVYSIDEVFLDVTNYLKTYKMSAHDLAMTIIRDVLKTTGITATAGIGPNMYLAKIAMDVVAKHAVADEDGVRIAELDVTSYRQLLWDHRPLRDFWRIGPGIEKKLESIGLYTMGDIARASLGSENDFHNEDLLYKIFGVNAELIIDHAWGYEPVLIKDIHAYEPKNQSIGSGQILHHAYLFEEAKTVLREMLDSLALDLVASKMVTNQVILTINYDRENLTNPKINYKGPMQKDSYGRKVPKHGRATINLDRYSSASSLITKQVIDAYNQVINPNLLIRKITISYNNLITEAEARDLQRPQQLNLMMDMASIKEELEEEDKRYKKEKNIQETMIELKEKFGKNAVFKASSLKEEATARQRNQQIGGHKS